jgi:hypothetical protein
MVRATLPLWSTLDQYLREELHAEYVMLGGELVGVARFGRGGNPTTMTAEETSCDIP